MMQNVFKFKSTLLVIVIQFNHLNPFLKKCHFTEINLIRCDKFL